MSKLKLFNNIIYSIEDYSTPNSFVIVLNSLTATEILETLTEENLSEIQFMTNDEHMTGTYLAEDNRILSACVVLPNGNYGKICRC